MATWLYQLDNSEWSANNYRLDIWEGERWEWPVKRATGLDHPPASGDKVLFFYAPSGCDEPGFYGLAVITHWIDETRNGERDRRFYFRPVNPSDRLKMRPWWNEQEAKSLAAQIRGAVKQGTLWPVPPNLAEQVIANLYAWATGAQTGGQQ